MASKEKLDKILNSINEILKDKGFELYVMKIEWYNKVVEEKFHLPYDPDTTAILVISTPDMFDLALKPFLKSNLYSKSTDAVDECTKYYMDQIQKVLPETEIIYDYEMIGPRHPKIIMQVASHVSGAAFYYQRKHIVNDPWEKDTFVMGICIHPKYGGWFALRSVIILKDVQLPDLPFIEAENCIPDEQKQIELLNLLNEDYMSGKYRDVIPVVKKYSDEQIKYFNTSPSERMPLIEEIIKAEQKQESS